MPKMRQDRAIPVVDFYGETEAWSTADLVHIEPLIERSQLFDWKIRPHRHSSLSQFFLLQKGGGVAHLDTVRYELSPPCILVVPEMCVHDFEWLKDSSGYVLSIASPLAKDLTREIGSRLTVFRKPSIVDISADQTHVETIFTAIQREHRQDLPLKGPLLDALVRTLIIWLCRHVVMGSKRLERPNRANRHYSRFAMLVDKHHKSQRTVTSYANEIGITPSHLNTVCQDLAGGSALSVIHARLFLAARRSLIYTEKTITGVSHGLGFSDPAYFTRFFKRLAGMTPREYRRKSGTYPGRE